MEEEPKGQIVAMGGGGFLMEPDNPLLDDFVLSLSPKKMPKVCFVPTAAADSATILVHFYRNFSGRAVATDLTIYDPSTVPRRPSHTNMIEDYIAEQDIIYVSGGNTVNMLAIWRAHGIDKILRKAWQEGKILCGVSAGMLCWFQGGVTDSFGDADVLHDGLGFIGASACPHFDGEEKRRPAYHQFIKEGLPAGYAADDGAALHFLGTKLVEAISSRQNASAYFVEKDQSGETTEKKISTRFLG
ncbi:MAG: peptidase E [Verrucomicrobiales bacterium]|nr:peptidase E [Verrucomicrobiales bacterium]